MVGTMRSRATSHSTAAERQILARMPDVGPGWRSLLQRLHQDLTSLAPDYQLGSQTSKMGGLRIELSDRFDESGDFADRADALVVTAESHVAEDLRAVRPPWPSTIPR
ncbi:hypothetical protein AB0942_34130 [Streptomyces nodosus]|uniref:hypothetical protein n=1 Tax=Streptomyces nodosus TaxID=40318 RepID=UPI003451B847